MTARSAEAAPLVLAADDDADILMLVAISLKLFGYEVVTAGDGGEALRLALELRPDLAVLDVTMPKLTGYEVTALLRAEATTSQMPIIMLTARVQEEDVQSGLAAGASDYLKKPFSPAELGARVEAALAGRAST